MAAFFFNTTTMIPLLIFALFAFVVYVVISLFKVIHSNTAEDKPIEPIKPKKKISMKLTMRAIVRWEQLLGKPFSGMGYSNEQDFDALLYCVALSSNRISCTMEEFTHTLRNEKLRNGMARDLSKNSIIMGQFNSTSNEEEGEQSNGSGYIKDLVSTLILSGLSAAYVLDEMQLCDLPLFIEAYQNKRKEEMESNRLWTYLSILPHVDSKKLQSARDLYPFPWEEKEIEEAAAKSIEEDSERLEAFFAQGKNYINQNYG